MSRPFVRLPPGLGSGFSVAAARGAGVSERRLRGGDLESPFWGVRCAPFVPPSQNGLVDVDALELRHRMDAYAQRMPEHRFFWGLAALVAWRGILPVPAPLLAVGVLAPDRAPRAAGVEGRRFAPHLVTVREHGGLRVTSPASTWMTLAPVLPHRDLVAVGSLLVTPPRGAGGAVVGPPLCTVSNLRSAIDAGPRPGIRAARRAVALVRVGARSRPEVHLWLALTEAGLPGLPEAQFDAPIRDATGALIGYGDLAFPEFRTYIEYQGDYHRLSRDAWARDITKRQRAREAGWHEIEIVRRELYPDPAPAVARTARALRDRGWR